MLVSDSINLNLFGWILITSSLIYTTQIKSIGSLPSDVVAFLAICACCFLNSWLSLLTLQRLSLRSYVTICSLMAYDKSGLSQGFCTILDLYQRRKNCYTLMRSYSFKSTAFLRLIGYSFSCFFLIVSLFRNQEGANCLNFARQNTDDNNRSSRK